MSAILAWAIASFGLQTVFGAGFFECGTYDVSGRISCQEKCEIILNSGSRSEFRFDLGSSKKARSYDGKIVRSRIRILEKKTPYTGRAKLQRILGVENPGSSRIKAVLPEECSS